MIQTHSRFVVFSLWFEVKDLKFLVTREPFSRIELQNDERSVARDGNYKLTTTDFKLISCQFFTPPVDGTIIEYQGLNP